MDFLADAVAEVDGPYSLVAIFLIGLYVVIWRWGGKLLEALNHNTEVTLSAKKEASTAASNAAEVAESIITNHGSRNLGDAVDRITEWLMQHMEETRADREQVTQLQQITVAHILEAERLIPTLQQRLDQIDERLDALEEEQQQRAAAGR